MLYARCVIIKKIQLLEQILQNATRSKVTKKKKIESFQNVFFFYILRVTSYLYALAESMKLDWRSVTWKSRYDNSSQS